MKKNFTKYELKMNRIFNLIFIVLFFCSETDSSSFGKYKIREKEKLFTDKIQKSIDSCYAIGGGTVILPKGIYV
jgi:abortive infection bacteriophage resistance protein